MKYLCQYTSMPVPEVLGAGICCMGPYFVMPFLDGRIASTMLKDPNHEGRHVLNPNIPDVILRRAYLEMAKILLELSRPGFQAIGVFEFEKEGFAVTKRPLTFEMNQWQTESNIRLEALPAGPFRSATDYFHNDAVINEEDCRKKYIARCLFRKIAREISTKHRDGTFRLYWDDLRPSNVLVDMHNLRMTGVIDWEFTYVVPAEFMYAAPWWLLLKSPQGWDADLNVLLDHYKPRLRLFLSALRECEDKGIKEGDGPLADSLRLSTRMEQSLDLGLFWFCVAVRHSSMLDEVYLTFLDKLYHGPLTSINDRIQLLSEEERDNLEEFVRAKMEQDKESHLDDHYPIDKLLDL
ncbi:hypothetical protein M501DRAFT_987253 [Patellaria atrata CBS 101060]|uniref:Aminoglycoside phosphotransferase domain-containing protein n=1 Tax=Patellaria atrata CBS 101060 TaxID=1346257 RepID=A0A9P4S771_9PEZI|nr:hypothetical protein M501DRAFT_987253 [Patellaria atrata CBS 101060]